MQVLYRLADGVVLGAGEQITPDNATQAVRTLTAPQAAKLSQPGTYTIDAQGVITVTPPPPPPATRPKNLADLKADWDAAQAALQTANAAYSAPGATLAQKADALRDGLVATNNKLAAVAKGVWAALNDQVPNT